MNDPSLEVAQAVVAAAQRVASAAGLHLTIAVCDRAGHLLVLARHQDALLASLEVAQVKARTAVFFGADTKHLPFDQPFVPALLGGVSYPVAFVPGGVLLRRAGEIVGGIGVGGGTADQDQACADAGRDALGT